MAGRYSENGACFTRQTTSQKEAIQEIKAGNLKLFVHKDGHEVDVIVSVSKLGNEYIKTKKDGIVSDNLLSLPDAP